jgi:hypothetical protein
MANFYKNAFYDPTTTAVIAVYACPSNANAIIQNIQVTNESGSKILKVSINDDSVSTVFQIAYASITGPTICNLASGPIILEENDVIRLESSVTSGISATIAILEINRDDQNGQN